MDKIVYKLKENIIEYLELEDIVPEDINNEDPLFVEGLGLDSVDALQLVVMLEEVFNVKINNPEKAKDILYSVNSIAKYIMENQDKK
jgi:acyl carrier protein